MNELLRMVVRTLNTIPVSGAENMSKLLGCINALESIMKEEPKAEKTKEDTK